MTRVFSRDPTVHRVLDRRLGHGPQRGEDVELLAVATARRLSARAYPEAARPGRTSSLNRNLCDRAGDALYALGAAPDTVTAARAGKVTGGAQRMIRYPGRRSDEQLRRARAREDEVAKRAAEERKRAAADRTDSPSDVQQFRRRARAAALFALGHSGRRYSMGSDRWNPIASGASPTGRMWTVADCSSFATWVLWCGLGRSGPDVVNGSAWQAGYTGTMVRHGRPVTNGRYEIGDCAIYGSGPGKHVVVCYQAGDADTALWASHGSAGGPYRVKLHYRPDSVRVRRYVA